MCPLVVVRFEIGLYVVEGGIPEALLTFDPRDRRVRAFGHDLAAMNAAVDLARDSPPRRVGECGENRLSTGALSSEALERALRTWKTCAWIRSS